LFSHPEMQRLIPSSKSRAEYIARIAHDSCWFKSKLSSHAVQVASSCRRGRDRACAGRSTSCTRWFVHVYLSHTCKLTRCVAASSSASTTEVSKSVVVRGACHLAFTCCSMPTLMRISGKTPEGHSFRVSFISQNRLLALLLMPVRSCCGHSTETSRFPSAPMM
jgi:hypothetical protein